MKIKNLTYETARRLSEHDQSIELKPNSAGSFDLMGPADVIEPLKLQERYAQVMPNISKEETMPEFNSAGELYLDLEFKGYSKNVSLVSLNRIGPIYREFPPARINIYGKNADLMDFDPKKERYDVIETFDLSLINDRKILEDHILSFGPSFKVPLDQMIDFLDTDDAFLKFRENYYFLQNISLEAKKEASLVNEATKEILVKTDKQPFNYDQNGNVEFRIPESDEIVCRNLEILTDGSADKDALMNQIEELESEWGMHIVSSEADSRTAANVRYSEEQEVLSEMVLEDQIQYKQEQYRFDKDHNHIDDRLEMIDRNGNGIDDSHEESLEESFDDMEIEEPEFERILWGDDDD